MILNLFDQSVYTITISIANTNSNSNSKFNCGLYLRFKYKSKPSFNLEVQELNLNLSLSIKQLRRYCRGNYFRLNVRQSKIGLDEWDKLEDMIALTKSYSMNSRNVLWQIIGGTFIFGANTLRKHNSDLAKAYNKCPNSTFFCAF